MKKSGSLLTIVMIALSVVIISSCTTDDYEGLTPGGGSPSGTSREDSDRRTESDATVVSGRHSPWDGLWEFDSVQHNPGAPSCKYGSKVRLRLRGNQLECLTTEFWVEGSHQRFTPKPVYYQVRGNVAKGRNGPEEIEFVFSNDGNTASFRAQGLRGRHASGTGKKISR